MSEQRVLKLTYQLKTRENDLIKDPKPFAVDTDDYHLSFESNGELVFKLKRTFYSVESAESFLKEFLRAWEVEISLQLLYADCKFLLREVELSNDESDGETGNITVHEFGYGSDNVTVQRSVPYVPEPIEKFKSSEDVEILFSRFESFLLHRERLASMVYACLSYLEWKHGGRRRISEKFKIAENILNKMGELTSTVGGFRDARKFNRDSEPRSFTTNENAWLREAVKLLIHRVGEYDYDPEAGLQLLTMKDLPSLD